MHVHWALLSIEYDRHVLNLIDEVLAMRRGCAITHIVDPVPELQRYIGKRDDVDKREALFRKASAIEKQKQT
jgi:hypothetical protein